ncbi:MAG: acyl carrier protein [Frankia sp.]
MSEITPDSRTDALEAQIREILIEKTGVDREAFSGTENLSLKELDIDSLAVLQLQAVIVDNHGIEIPEGSINMTVGAIAAFVDEYTREVS